MREREPIVESFPVIKLDEHIFDALGEIARHIENEKNRKLLENTIERCKRGSLEYAEETLDAMLGEVKPQEEKKEEDMTETEKRWVTLGGKEEKPSHQIISRIGALSLIMDSFGIPREGWPKDDPKDRLIGLKKQQPLRTVALRYAFGEALMYEKLTQEKHMDKEEALGELGLKGIVDSDFIEQHVVRKIDRLPVDIREHIVE